LKRGGREWSSG